jgi:acyl-homoserine lactone acylase PvdQ
MRNLKIGAAALAALVLIGLTAVITADRLSQPTAPARATLIAQAAHYHARIQRDHYGVPHISGPPIRTWPSGWASRIARTISPPSRARR